MAKALLEPTAEQTFLVVCDPDDKGEYNFSRVLEISRSLERKGEIEKACNVRYRAFQRLYELLPEGEEVELEWTDANSRAALVLIHSSAIDHFLIGDWEMCAGMLELLLELDPEDHLEATIRLAYAYVALGEYDLFDEVINDVSDKYADKQILNLWSEFRRNGHFREGDLVRFRKRFAVFYDEFTSDDHPVSSEYLEDIERERPSDEALARELWLQTEHLWQLFPGFIETLRKTAN